MKARPCPKNRHHWLELYYVHPEYNPRRWRCVHCGQETIAEPKS